MGHAGAVAIPAANRLQERDSFLFLLCLASERVRWGPWMIKSVLVVGAGSAGLMAALALKVKMPQLSVMVLRDPATPVIGVGESTTPNMPEFLFNYLKLGHR